MRLAHPLLDQQPYWYQMLVEFATNAAVGATADQTLRITDTHFVCTQIKVFTRIDTCGQRMTMDDMPAATAVDGAGGVPDAAVLVFLEETGTDRQLSNMALDGAVWNPVEGGPLPRPKLFKKSSTVKARFTLERAANTNQGIDCRLVLEGYHDYGLQLPGD